MLSVFRFILSRNRSVEKTRGPAAQDYYSQPESALPDIRAMLEKLGGGSVDLFKDDCTGIATLCLNHPEKRNAISGKMMVDLLDAVEHLESWTVGKGVLLYGKGGNFCSGGDLTTMRHIANPDDGFKMATFMHHVLHRLHALPLVTVALVEGSGALGGGAEIAVSCDYRLMTREAAGIGFLHGRMGIVPAWGGGTRLVRLAGPRLALDLLLTARMVRVPEALAAGVADGVVDRQDAVSQALGWLEAKTWLGAQVVRAAKSIVSRAADENTEKTREEERRIFAPLWGGPANREALSRFFNRASKTKD